MAVRTMHRDFSGARAHERFAWFERYTIRKFHPRKLFIDSISLMWAVYFLWNQDWLSAIVVAVAVNTLSMMSVWNVDTNKMSETTLGKIALLHLNPVNLATQIVGLIPLVYGIWTHSTELILAGLSIVMLGHALGWNKVDRREPLPNGTRFSL
jgi:hypothetical protein